MDDAIFAGWGPILRTLLVTTLAYPTLCFALRISGHRTLSKFNAFDFVITIALGSTLASTIVSNNVSLTQGLVGLFLLGAETTISDTATIESIKDEEEAHFLMLKKVIEGLGGDPTAETPGADVDGVAASGIVKVLSDPRTTLHQCLEAMLIVELTDNDAWQNLIEVATQLGLEEQVKLFEQAKREEDEHLQTVRHTLKEFTMQKLSA